MFCASEAEGLTKTLCLLDTQILMVEVHAFVAISCVGGWLVLGYLSD